MQWWAFKPNYARTRSPASQSSNSGWEGFAPCTPKSFSVSTIPLPKYSCQIRFTVTRLVSVGHDAEVLEGEELPGASQSALNLVEDERGLVLVGQLAARLQEFGRRFLDATFALDGLQHDTADLVVHRIAQRFHIVARHEAHAFQHGIEALAILCLAGERERAHGEIGRQKS